MAQGVGPLRRVTDRQPRRVWSLSCTQCHLDREGVEEETERETHKRKFLPVAKSGTFLSDFSLSGPSVGPEG